MARDRRTSAGKDSARGGPGRGPDGATGLALLVARVYTGQFFLRAGLRKVARGFLLGEGLLPQLQQFAAHTPHAWFKAWLAGVVIPHDHLFALLTCLGELLAAAGLIAGVLTRYAAAGGVFMVVNYLFSKGWPNPAATADKHFLVLLLVVLIGGAGRWSVDGWRRRR